MKLCNLIPIICVAFTLLSTPCIGNESILKLTPEEKAWIAKKHTVHVRIGNAPPFMLTTGKIEGMAIDYLVYIFNRNGIKFKYIYASEVTWPQALNYIKQHEVVDMVPTAKITAERKKQMLFTDEYLFAPWVIFTRSDSEFLSSIDDLKGKTVSVKEGYVMHKKLQQEYPGINLKVSASSEENYAENPIKDLSSGLVDAYIGNLIMTTYIIQTKGYTNIKVAAPTPFDNHNQAMAIRNDWPELVSIVNKTLAAMTSEENAAIRNRWLTVKYEYGISKVDLLKWISTISFFSLIITVIIMVWNRKLKTEVTERKQAEEKTRASKVYLDKILNNIGDPVFVKDDQYRLTLVNDAFCSILGLRKGEIIGKTLAENLPSEEMEHFLKIDRQVLTDGQENLCEELRTVKGGKRITTVTKKTRYIDENGDKFIVGVIRDITERKMVEDSLAESEKRFKALHDASFGGVIIHEQGLILDCNQSLSDMTGFTHEELVGMDGFKLVEPDSLDLVMKNIKRGYDQGYEVEGLRKDGSVYPLAIRGKSVHYKDREVRVIEFRDITRRKMAESALQKSEERFRELADLLPLTVFEIDRQGDLIYANQMGFESTGYSPEDIEEGLNVKQIIVPNERSKLVKNIAMIIEERIDSNNEYMLLRKDGTIFSGIIYSRPMIQNGAVIGLRGIVADISDRKRIEQEKEELESHLRQAYKMEAIGTMAGGIAHDFNNMLAIIIGNADMALDDVPENNPGRQKIHQIIQASQRVKDLVKQILLFSRQADQKLLPIKLCSTIKESLKLLRSTTPTTVSIVQDICDGYGLIMADITQINQLIINLCSNAIHAMDEKGTLEVNGEIVDLEVSDTANQPGMKPGRYFKLSVSDTGSGIAEDIKERIFDPFYTTKDVNEGTGMGLSIVLGIVKSHNGFIQVNSKPGAGTVFTLFFPIIENAQPLEKEEVSDESPRGDQQILFVDDEEMLAMMGGRMLERLGYHVTVKSSSNEALETFKSNPEAFDLVITDQSMPNMSGAELAVGLLEIRPDIPIILCTGYSKKISKEEAKRLGIRKYLHKPLDRKHLANSVREVLEA